MVPKRFGFRTHYTFKKIIEGPKEFVFMYVIDIYYIRSQNWEILKNLFKLKIYNITY